MKPGITTSILTRNSALMLVLAFAGASPTMAQVHKSNTTTGLKAGAKLTTAKHNTADGFKALLKDTTGGFNTAVGSGALKKNTGSSNVAMGFQALFKNTAGQFNVAIGDGAMLSNVSGSNNVALGMDAGANTTGSDNILIDHVGIAGESGIIRIGTSGTHTKAFIAGQIIGDGSGLANIPATNLTGQISGGQIAPASVTNNSLAPNLTLGGTTSGAFTGAFTGSGTGITELNASNIASGTLADARLSGNVALRNLANAFTSGSGKNTFTSTGDNAVTLTGRGLGNAAPGTHVLHIVSSQSSSSSCLALQVGDPAPQFPDNFITFFNSDGGTMGAIDAVDSTSVAYKTTGADFAEILPMAEGAKAQEATEIVPVHAGKIGDWNRADQFMVISNQAGFVGNDPGREVEAEGRHHRIAFLGQVPVKVHGTVNTGDYIIASEKNDGTGIAKSADTVGIDQMNRVVGRAWESSEEKGLKTVNTAVGLDQTSLVVPALQRLERENQILRERLQKLESRLNGQSLSAGVTSN